MIRRPPRSTLTDPPFPDPTLFRSLRRLDAIGFQELDGAGGRNVPALLVGGPDLQCGDDLGVALHLGLRGNPRRTMVGPAHRLGAVRSEEHTSELQSLMRISYAVFCLKKKKEHMNTISNDYV